MQKSPASKRAFELTPPARRVIRCQKVSVARRPEKKSETFGEYPYPILHETRNIAERGDYVSFVRMAVAGELGRLSRGAKAPS